MSSTVRTCTAPSSTEPSNSARNCRPTCARFRFLARSQTATDEPRLAQAHIEGVDFERTELKLRGQPALRHDLIIAADGIKSGIRGHMMARRGEVDETIPTGEAAYRVILPREAMESDPELKALIDAPVATRWIGTPTGSTSLI